jgi:uncharacterized protein (DUF362 family)
MVHGQSDQKNIENLRMVYADPEYLQSIIIYLFGNHINAKSVCGKNVLLKPNWVNHNKKPDDEICLRTHSNLIIAVINVLLQYKPAKITIGDSPIQGCNWDKICTESFINEVNNLCEEQGVPVSIYDFRRTVFDTLNNKVLKEQNPASGYIIFDVGKDSFLEPVTNVRRKLFRIAHYDYEILAEMHHSEVHKYCITKNLFDADIVISIPKVKTHQKAGITAALKNFVGLNGDKDYLPHHRHGGTKNGGDSYQGNNLLRNISEKVLDISNKNISKPIFVFWQKLSIILWRISMQNKNNHWIGGWHGNDTTWRMILDLNKIIVYAKPDGTLSDIPQRQIYSLCDGIIVGQGDGPLFPDPLPLGFLSFTNNAAVNDYVFAYLMRLKPEKISLLTNAFNIYEKRFDNITLNNKLIQLQDLDAFVVNAKPAPGWEDYLKD